MQRRKFLQRTAALGAVAMGAGAKALGANLPGHPLHSSAGVPLLTLNNGVVMPQFGYGVLRLRDQKECQKCVEDAFEAGYRLIDTAQSYFNEAGVGAALKHCGLRREQFFVTTKLASDSFSEELALKTFDKSMQKLGLDYLDLFLVHQPFGDVYGAWRALSRLYREGRIKAIGVSNFYADRIMDFCLNNDIVPAVNQIECHAFYQRREERAVMDEFNIKAEAWAPLAQANAEVLGNPVLANIAENHGKSVAQIMLRYLMELGIIAIPMTSKKHRLVENISIFDFSLDEREKAEILALDTGRFVATNHRDPAHVKRTINLVRDRRKKYGWD